MTEQLLVKINSTLRCVGQPPVDEPPAPVVFSPNPVGGLDIVNDEGSGVRLLLSVEPVSEDIMLFGQAPCSAGRMKPRRVCYLGLLGPATNGQCDLTALYTARFGQPGPGQKVFIATCQQKNGWKAPESVTSAVVPPKSLPGKAQATAKTEVTQSAATETPKAASAPADGSLPVSRAVYKGCTPGAQGEHRRQPGVPPVSIPCTPLVHGFRVALRRLRMLGMRGVGAW